MRIENKPVYIADDNTPFNSQAECEKYEREVLDKEKKTSYFRIIHGADLTEGRGYSKHTLVEVFGPEWCQQQLVEDWCFRNPRTIGRKVEFVQGCSPMEGWKVLKIDRAEYLNPKICPQVGDWKGTPTKVKLVMGQGETGLVQRLD